jgi:hypothetical protein
LGKLRSLETPQSVNKYILSFGDLFGRCTKKSLDHNLIMIREGFPFSVQEVLKANPANPKCMEQISEAALEDKAIAYLLKPKLQALRSEIRRPKSRHCTKKNHLESKCGNKLLKTCLNCFEPKS